MKNSIITLTTMALTLVFAIQGCDKPANNVERSETSVIEAQRDLEISKNKLQADIQVYRTEVANDIAENNQKIVDIKREIQTKEVNSRVAHVQRVEQLERQNNDLKRQLDNYSHTTEQNWSQFKRNFNDSLSDLGDSLDDFFTKSTTSIN
jgi:TolA-binding protein